MAVPMKFEELLPLFAMNGTCEALEHNSPGLPTVPAQIIRKDQAWDVYFKWNTTGALNYIMGGKWHLRVLLEEMGVGETGLPAQYSQAVVNFVSAPNAYSYLMHIPANVVRPGVYKLVATITMVGPSNVPGPIAGFGEGDMLQFYDGGPISSPLLP